MKKQVCKLMREAETPNERILVFANEVQHNRRPSNSICECDSRNTIEPQIRVKDGDFWKVPVKQVAHRHDGVTTETKGPA